MGKNSADVNIDRLDLRRQKAKEGENFSLRNSQYEDDKLVKCDNCGDQFTVYVIDRKEEIFDTQIAKGNGVIVKNISMKSNIVNDLGFYCSKKCSDEGCDAPLLAKK